jgi:hypothetical protein
VLLRLHGWRFQTSSLQTERRVGDGAFQSLQIILNEANLFLEQA